MRQCLALLASAAIAAAAEVPATADGFWPLPQPDWMQDQELPSVAGIALVRPGMPAAALHLEAGDLAISTGGIRTTSQADFVLAVRIAASRADNRGEYQRDGKTLPIRLPAFSAWGRWGIDLEDRPVGVPDGLAPTRVPAWTAMPVRVRLAALRRIAAGGDRAWVDVLLNLRLAAGDSTPPPDAVPAMPDAYLQRVADWWRACALAKGLPTPCDDAGEALFRAAHLAWPVESAPAAGKPSTGDAATDAILLAMAGPKAPATDELKAAGSRLANGGLAKPTGEAGTYLGQCLAAVIDPDSHGGWPYRSWLVWEPAARAKVVAGLDAVQDPALTQLVALGRIGPAVMDGDEKALLGALATLHQGSPWLAQRALRIACHAASMHRKTPWITGRLLASDNPVLTPAMRARLRWLAERGGDVDDVFGGAPGALDALPATWRHHAQWRQQAQTGRNLAGALNHLVWGIATDPAGLDPDSAIPLARQLVLASADGVQHWQADTIAAAFARGGLKDDAVWWELAALTLARSARMADKDRDTAVSGYSGRLATLRQGTAISDGVGPAAVAASAVLKTGTAAGQASDGKQIGVWKTTTATGTVIEELGYRGGEPAGRWVARGPAGELRWSGWIDKGSRLGWWRIATADGGTTTGWYDGAEGGIRCGWWRVYDAAGRLRSEGPCQNGVPVAPWRAIAADGTATVVPPLQVVLPADPPLPAQPSAVERPTPDF